MRPALSVDIPAGHHWVRGVVLGNSQDVQVTAQVIDTVTGQVVAFSATAGGANPGSQTLN